MSNILDMQILLSDFSADGKGEPKKWLSPGKDLKDVTNPYGHLPVKSTDPWGLRLITITSGLRPYCSYFSELFVEGTELQPPPAAISSPWHYFLVYHKGIHRETDLSKSTFLTWKELSSQRSVPNFHPLCLLEQYAVLSRVDKTRRLSLYYAHRMTEI